ncbi:peptide ABC transporter substrate-binding protein [bacterium (Candidatus Blackallbacteria) CG17_big_fil_post_rev_8_21_14_2_50_48_46]|uniref:Peptide ABC transporter substrate-binding protein n=1 Tax=bacterium (Candidatus Blackallbacteria) CG17_big_fil_post_rev_8_21_14_2_50_48_46 TaxID=2014261 RepID=A0A2M7G434_9BACT|nr:MAG: peptide ABC transporter substrate-binding protein [bacterium (Candidatus Blackallbacteria) CG18_big_fil_WC_8_21_14_2_50_49_26]PIW16531.1 MAG: peptide ABC transporter substrate-binding protein [bacterium (Candidatus Blackallbacteria) CG17_big_fil_post_rev_8_21_14_2_50_48_46]PIW46039.1 MAG: peptide ABC transporter substrate-binding protein [bacterium (Candidatus Blackallbacteria) CG13_big_fil_rev_8_21_14_2_50_49_14]
MSNKTDKSNNPVLLEVKGLKKHFPIKRGILFSKQVGAVKAVDGLDLFVREGETLGMVGESGCGKSTTGRLILRLIEPTEGEVIFQGQDLLKLNNNDMRAMRRQLQMVFQNPYASLDPRMTVGDIIAEPLRVHKMFSSSQDMKKRVRELLDCVGLNPSYTERFPHEFSGGQRQRIGIARALALNPKLIIADEPVSALDVSVQAQVLNLLNDLQAQFNLTFIFIAHNLSTVNHISDRVAVMYLGKVVELAENDLLYANPKHPYTQALMSAVPEPDPLLMRGSERKARIILEGDIPSPVNPPSGCRFHTRCWEVKDICKTTEPPLVDTGNGHYVACHLHKAAAGETPLRTTN